MSTITDAMLEVQEARNARARALKAESDAAIARADEAKARLTMAKHLGGSAAYPQIVTNLCAEWEHWTVTARRKWQEAGEALAGR